MIKKILLAGMFALSTVACGGDECDDAADKVEECNIGGGNGTTTNDDVECSGTIECQAKCFNDATCDEIKNGSEKFSKCVLDCGT